MSQPKTHQEIPPATDGANLRIGIVVGRFNQDIGDGLLASCTAALMKFGVSAKDVSVTTVPGALEIPLVLQAMARSGKFDALIALGAVIRGETYHFEIVSNESCAGITRVQLDTGVPIANGIFDVRERRSGAGARCAKRRGLRAGHGGNG